VAQVLKLARERGGIPAYPEGQLYELPAKSPNPRRALQFGALVAAAGAAVLAARALR
jgi:hypothetical protein